MKQFFKTMFASVLGVLIASGILVLGGIFTLVGMAASSSSSTEYKPKPNSVFKISLKGSLAEQGDDSNPFASFMNEGETPLNLKDLLSAIKIAKENDNIKGIYLESSGLSAAPASIQALRNALVDFKGSGKFIIAYGDNFGQSDYYLSTVADSLFVNPQGGVGLVGLASQGWFYTGLADKLGVEHYIFKVGTYKSAVEPFFLTKFSEANREQLTSFLGSIWNNMTTAIAESRKISQTSLNEFLNQGKALGDVQELLNYKLVDGLRYKYEVENCVRDLAGQDSSDKLKTTSFSKIINIKPAKKNKSENEIAVLYAVGSIQEETSTSPFTGETLITENVAEELQKLKDDEDVKAVVFRVNSPGGSAYISDQIWKQVVELKKVKPIVVSMGDYAASGGYYISCAANKIVAEPTTLTGSIGVFGVIRNLTGLLGKVGLTTDVVKTNNYADLGDMSRPMREDEKALIQKSVEKTYDTFLSRCADGRGMSKDSIDHIGQGRVWTGEQALKLGLVDELGGIDTAIEIAAQLAELDNDYVVTTKSGKKDFFTELFEKQLEDVRLELIKGWLGDEEYELYRSVQEMKAMEGIQARLPFDVRYFN